MNQTLPTLGAARGALVSLSSLWLAVGACAEAPPPSAGDVAGARVAIAVAPLSLPGVADATWTLTVSSPGGEVWTKTVTSSGYGDGAGGLAYVGPCDASYATNTVTVELIDLTADGGGAITDFRNPGPVSKTAPCDPNGDTAVGFDITVARAANQGFFDVAVSFDDVFCSAKLDCVPELLFNGAARDTTLVLAFACASGEGTATTLHMAAPKLTCSDGTELVVDPTLGPGNTGESNAHVYQVASYRGREAFSGLEKCYWNTAIGVDATTFTANSGVTCSVTAKVSASVGAWDDGQTPEGAVWPFIDVDVPVVADGALVCASHALDVDGSGVATDYALPDARETLDVGMSCGGCDGGPCAPAVATGAPVTPFATEGAGWSWGADEGGALGNGPAETTNKLTPVAITTAGGVPAT
ncbi:MAG: hypothetical protein KC635_14080, partial [Myxococcales bacterium]|nr:hypothetical protein [Myxococcales bacterium]